MRGDDKLINIRYTDGKLSRIPRGKAEPLVNEGRAFYVSNTIYRAAQAGVEIKKGQTEKQIKAAIREALNPKKAEKPRQEADTKQKRKRGKHNKDD